MPPRSEPVRTCTGCGARKKKKAMMRVVADPSGGIIPDLKGKLPARGAYVCYDGNCIRSAAAGRLPAALRISRSKGIHGEDLVEMVQDALRKRILSLIGLARKGGMITTGTNLVEGDLRRGTGDGWVALVARDASEDIADRIRERLRSSGTSTWTLFTKADLGDAVGKSPRSVLLIKDQGLGEAVMETINRYLAVMNKGGKAV